MPRSIGSTTWRKMNNACRILVEFELKIELELLVVRS
jgi:hypothetical protein